MFVSLLPNTAVERKTLTKNLCTVSQHSPTSRNALCTTGETGKSTLHNLVENPLGIRISTGKQENQDWKEKVQLSRKDHNWFCIKFYIILFTQVKEILSTRISVTTQNFKFKCCYFNMSGDIATQTFVPSHQMVI